MTGKHTGLPVKGYVDQPASSVDLVNDNKVLEERCLRAVEAAKAAGADHRMVALAFTGIQESFMWLNRSIFRPARIELED
jgi:hypothetical protein